jgi:hypothetical protein
LKSSTLFQNVRGKYCGTPIEEKKRKPMKLNNQQFPDKKLESFKAKTNRGFQDNLQKLLR